MSRLKVLFMFSAVLLFGSRSAFGTNFAVGTCEPKLTSYSTIAEAVSTVPAGSIIEVCPGTYPEQFTISKPLTLEGIASGNLNEAIITVPSAGLSENAPNFFAQVYVTAGPVNITNITVDGLSNGLGISTQLAGIYYGAGSSGVIKDVTTRFQLDNESGIGIIANNSNSTNESLTIQNCSIHDFDFAGILVQGKYTATIKANLLDDSAAPGAIFAISDTSDGSITDNVITGPGRNVESQGVTVDAKAVTITGNTVVNFSSGLVDFDGASYTSNIVRNVVVGISLSKAGAAVESNNVTQAFLYGIGLSCAVSTVKGNTISDAGNGIGQVPSGFSSTNSYFNVAVIQQTCADANNAALPKWMSPPRRPVAL
jgi:hypothetical protein